MDENVVVRGSKGSVKLSEGLRFFKKSKRGKWHIVEIEVGCTRYHTDCGLAIPCEKVIAQAESVHSDDVCQKCFDAADCC